MAYPEIRYITINVNKRRDNVILGDSNRTIWGSDSIMDTIGGIKFKISPQSFYQVNPVQTEKLYIYIKEVANKWKDQIDPKVYEALMSWNIEITD